MNEKKETLSFDEREIQKHKRKKHVESKKTKKQATFKTVKKTLVKSKKSKPSHRFTDYDSEDWYD